MSEKIAVIKNLYPRVKLLIRNLDVAYNIVSGQIDTYQKHDEWVMNKIELFTAGHLLFDCDYVIA